ncbi:hypothetical protein ACS0TY_027306 [Phlomoides rotata]
MAASTNFLSLTPKTLSLHHSNSAAYAASLSTLFTPSGFKPLVLSLSSISNRPHPTSSFIRSVSITSEWEEEVVDFSGAKEPRFSPDLKVFVGNLPFSIDSAALADLFQQAGNVEVVEVIYDKTTGRSRGFGFVTMSTVAEAEAAAQQLNGYELDGRTLRVNHGPPPPKSENSSFEGGRGPRRSSDNTNKLHVGNLGWDVDNVALETMFSEHGNVKEARVVYDRENGRSRGFGFVTYSSPEEVNSAIDNLDGAVSILLWR